MNDGWIKIYPERLLNWEWYHDTNMVRVFLHLLLNANYKSRSWQGIEIKRGQLVTSLAGLSAELGLSIKSIRTCLTRLQKTGEIGKQTASRFSIITVCNYAKYQGSESGKGQAKGKQRECERAGKGNAKGQHLKNIKNNINNNTPYNPPKGETETKPKLEVAPGFEEPFGRWLEYKRGRRQTYKSDISLKACYNKLFRLSHGDPAVAMAIVEQSAANNWAGLFELKDENNGNDRQSTRQAERAALAAEYAELMSELAAENAASLAKVR